MPSFRNRSRTPDVDPDDRELIRLMLQAGEKLASRPRETTHYLHFQDETAARRARLGAQAAGFEVELVAPGDGIVDWQLRASHTIIVDEPSITAARRALTPVAEQAGGRYDGWDTYADDALDQMRLN
jgi:regulator of RNase E activity RraB